MAKRNRVQTETRILDAACELLLAEGFDGLRVNALSSASGCDKVLLYRYFGDMEGVLTALAGREAPRLFSDAQGAIQSGRAFTLSQLQSLFGTLLERRRFLTYLARASNLYKNPLTETYQAEERAFLSALEGRLETPDDACRALLHFAWAVAVSGRESSPLPAIDATLPSLTFLPVDTADEAAAESAEEEDLPANLL